MSFFMANWSNLNVNGRFPKFRNGSCSAFISTDLASRGLDIPEIKNVIHFDIPVRLDEYVHRNGRTARMEAEGSAFFFVWLPTKSCPVLSFPIQLLIHCHY